MSNDNQIDSREPESLVAMAKRLNVETFTVRNYMEEIERLRAALAHAAKAEPVIGDLSTPQTANQIAAAEHRANEWADAACNGLVWLRNIRDGFSSADDAIAEMEENLARIRALIPQPLAHAAKAEPIDAVVNRFLAWNLPDDFSPDCGITFKRESDYEHPEYGRHKYKPIGTNLFTAEQAKAMFEYCLQAPVSAAAPQPQACNVPDGWRPIETAPKDGSLLRLLVEFEDNATEDGGTAPTIGANSYDHTGEDTWDFAGWSWSHDCFTAGVGKPIKWMPYSSHSVLDATPTETEVKS